jgi:hypothetical protein
MHINNYINELYVAEMEEKVNSLTENVHQLNNLRSQESFLKQELLEVTFK